ncbi:MULTISPECIES: hypothetical protein [unclassified Gilliamella]|uniref:hypothetical protein n=1 Tax=unclassified Gilliamella TaxID=2685620 RepID=UPI00226A00A0|nr:MULTISPECIES: hypothetical protein [unclassified Gilliamella]MCX8588650.1 hypothetical protein [Gilliamella sp. B3801]MCX8592721.1 hypothetical protein [Gilliamella sp. B3804]
MKINRTTIKIKNYLISLFLAIFLPFSCNAYENQYIDTKFVYEAQYDRNNDYFKSKELDMLFNLNNEDYYLPDTFGLDAEFYYVRPICIKGNLKDNYILLYDKNDILRDVLPVANKYVYSIDVRLENNKNGICLGTFDKENDFFEIEKIYEVTKEIKLKPLSIETKILDCPIPADYNTEDIVGMEDYFKYGVLRNRK